MNRQLLVWKSVVCKDRGGNWVEIDLATIVDRRYRGKLLSLIFSMPCKKPISFNKAINMMSDAQITAFNSGQVSRKPGHYHWYTENFVEWISSLGYHIELTGDEFEEVNQLSI